MVACGEMRPEQHQPGQMNATVRKHFKDCRELLQQARSAHAFVGNILAFAEPGHTKNEEGRTGKFTVQSTPLKLT